MEAPTRYRYRCGYCGELSCECHEIESSDDELLVLTSPSRIVGKFKPCHPLDNLVSCIVAGAYGCEAFRLGIDRGAWRETAAHRSDVLVPWRPGINMRTKPLPNEGAAPNHDRSGE